MGQLLARDNRWQDEGNKESGGATLSYQEATSTKLLKRLIRTCSATAQKMLTAERIFWRRKVNRDMVFSFWKNSVVEVSESTNSDE